MRDSPVQSKNKYTHVLEMQYNSIFGIFTGNSKIFYLFLEVLQQKLLGVVHQNFRSFKDIFRYISKNKVVWLILTSTVLVKILYM